MNAKDLLLKNGSATVSDLVALGETRHKARHDLEALVIAGAATKVKEGTLVTYTRVEALENQDDPKVRAVVSAMRPTKAISVGRLAARTGLPAEDVSRAIVAAVALGLAVQPFKTSRFRRA
jgi:hypothetical protein